MLTKVPTGRLPLMILAAVGAASILVACATDVKKTEFGSDTTPTVEINKAQADLDRGVQTDEDVLDSKDFTQALSYLNKAKKQQQGGADQSKIYDSVGYARAYLDHAKAVSDARRPSIDGLLKSRRAAIDAGARDMNATREDFASNDQTVQNNIEDLTTNKDVKDFNALQPSYLALEYTAIKTKNLEHAHAYIQRAKEEGAESRAPHTYAQAQTSISNAENVIAADRHNQEAISAACNKATIDAKLTLDATELTKQKKINESVALDLIKARDANQQLSQNLNSTEQKYKKNSAEMRAEQNSLKGELAQTESEIRLSLAPRNSTTLSKRHVKSSVLKRLKLLFKAASSLSA